MTEPARTVFFGTGAFAVPILEALTRAPDVIRLVGIVTAPSRPAGRGLGVVPSAVAASVAGATTSAEATISAGAIGAVSVLKPTSLRDPATQAEIGALQPALLVLADYGRIVPEAILAMAPLGALNVHPSLLPRHRGATPVPAAILAGDAETGVTIIRMDAGIDTGPIVAQQPVRLAGDETAPELEARLAREGADLLATVLPVWVAHEIEARPQSDEGATSTRLLRRSDGAIDARRSAASLERQVRAYQPWPGSFFEVDGERFTVEGARVRPLDEGTPPGTLVAADHGLGLATSDGLLEIVVVRPAGRTIMSGPELLRGRPGLLGRPIDGLLGG